MANFDAELRRVAGALGEQLATLESARKELVSRGDAFESRLGALESSVATARSQVTELEIRQADAEHAWVRVGRQLDELAAVMRVISADLGARGESVEPSAKSGTLADERSQEITENVHSAALRSPGRQG
jgi:chromosome segregation ATPase